MNKIIKIIFFEYNYLLIFFLLIFFLVYIRNNNFKEKFKVLKYTQIFIILLIAPTIILLLYIFKLAELGDCLGFLGGYFGVVGTVYTIIWEENKIKKEKNSQIDNYIRYIVNKNLNQFGSNILFFQQYFYKNYLFNFLCDDIEIRKDKFNFINFNDFFIENNLEYILSLEFSNQILELYNIIKELNKNLKFFLGSCEKRQKEILINFEFSDESEKFKNSLKNFIKQPHNDYTKELFPNGISIDIDYIFKNYVYLQCFAKLYQDLSNLEIEKKIIYTEKFSDNVFIKNLGLDETMNKILDEVHSLKKDDINFFNLRYNDIFLDIEKEVFFQMANLIFFNYPQFWFHSEIYCDFEKKINMYNDYVFWIKKFNNLMLEYYKILLLLESKYTN